MIGCVLGGLVAVALLRLVTQTLAEALEASGRAEPTGPSTDWTVPFSLLWVATVGLFTLPILVASGAWWALPLWLASLAVSSPGLAARVWFAPRGWLRAAWWATRLSTGTWRSDPAGSALFVGAWALHRRPRDPEAEAWLLRRQEIDPRPLTAAALAGHGLLAARRGDRADARALLEAVRWFPPAARPVPLERVVRQWRAAEAATRGDWAAVTAVGAGSEPGPTHPRRITPGPKDRALGALAAHLEGRPDRATGDDLERVLRATPSLAPEIRDRLARPAPALRLEIGDPWIDGLGHLEDLREGRGDPAVTARRLERGLGERSSSLAARAVALGAPRPDEVPARLRDEVVARLAEALSARPLHLPSADPPALLRDALDRLREERFPSVELAAGALGRRVGAGRDLPVLDEVREWQALREAYGRGCEVCGPADRLWLFRAVYAPLVALSVRLFNDRGEKELSRALSRWLLAEATALGDEAAVDLMQRNLSV